MALHRSPPTTGEEPQAVVEALEQVGGGHGADPGRGQLDGQRHAVETAAGALEADGRYTRTFEVEARDPDGQVCARMRNEVYLRLETRGRQAKSAF